MSAELGVGRSQCDVHSCAPLPWLSTGTYARNVWAIHGEDQSHLGKSIVELSGFQATVLLCKHFRHPDV